MAGLLDPRLADLQFLRLAALRVRLKQSHGTSRLPRLVVVWENALVPAECFADDQVIRVVYEEGKNEP